MCDIWMDVDATLSEVPVNVLPLIDDTDFKTREVSITFDAAGMDLTWNFVTTGGTMTKIAVVPTSAGEYDWLHQGDGIYTIEIPDSGGASINNDIEGFGWFTGIVDGVLPWRGPVIGFRAAAVNDAFIDTGNLSTVIAGAVWDELLTDHNTPGTPGKILQGIGEGWISAEAAINDVAPTIISFITDLTSVIDSFYSDAALVFITGALKGQARIITTYDGTTKTLNFDEGFTFAPTDADKFIILATHTHSISEIVTAVMGAIVEGDVTLKHSLQISNAAGAGILAGAATNSITIRDQANSKDRMIATVDADGNRSAVTVSVD